MRIVVLAGGTSTEREVSIVSGTQVTRALRSRGHRAVLLDVFAGEDREERLYGSESPKDWAAAYFRDDYNLEEDVDYISSFNDRIGRMEQDRKKSREGFFGPNVIDLCKAADVVFLALHGSNGEDGRIQATFDLLNIPYTGSGYLGSALAMDKGMAKQLFRENQVPTPKGYLQRFGEVIKDPARQGTGYPCVVKPNSGGSSVGVSICQDETAFEAALKEAFRHEDTVVVEQYIKGREFSVGIVDDTVYPIIEIAPISGFYDYKNKYQPGSTVETCPADLPLELTKQMQKWAKRAYRALGLTGYGRIDIMMDDEGGIFCLEANTLPGMTPTSLLPQEAAAIGIDFADLCEKLVEVSLKGTSIS